jgi:hypothetical protein
MIKVLGFDSQQGLGIFLFIIVFRPALGPTQPPIEQIPVALTLGVKRPKREADHSPLSNVKVKSAWSHTSTPQYIFLAWCLAKHRDSFTFTLLPNIFLILENYLCICACV